MEVILVPMLVIGIAACAYEIVTRPPLVEIDEDDMRRFIQSTIAATTRGRKAEESASPEAETYYDVYRRIAESKENLN